MQQPPPPAPGAPRREPAPAPRKKGPEEVSGSTSARVTIQLPADVRLWVDDVYCPVRSFDTPALQPGRKYFYTLKTETVRDGRTVVQSRRVVLSAGQDVNVDFSEDRPQTVQR